MTQILLRFQDSDYCKKSVALSRIFVFERSEIKTKLSDRQWLTNIFNGAHVRQNKRFLQNMTIHRTVQKTKVQKIKLRQGQLMFNWKLVKVFEARYGRFGIQRLKCHGMPPYLSRFVCAFHPAFTGSSRKHTIHALSIYI